MIQSSLKAFLLVAGFAALASASTIPGTITGTCGFYQGTPSNVVYSQNFSGNGTFCAGFMSGGSFTATGTMQLGDIFAATSHEFVGTAPAGYTEFVTVNSTLQATQQYLFTPTTPPTTPTGTIQLYTSIGGGPDDGTGSGTCQQGVSLNGISNINFQGGSLLLAITFGQPVNITETASLVCNLSFTHNSMQPAFGDSGLLEISGAIANVFDANGVYRGMASYQSVTPEPATFMLVAVLGLPLLLNRRVRSALLVGSR